MELLEALEIVKTLARGIEPISGKPFDKDSVYNHPKIIRALYIAAEHFPRRKKTAAERQAENEAKGLPRNTGLPWTEEARQDLAQSYRSGESIELLARNQERSKTAVAAELCKQGLLSNEEAVALGIRMPQTALQTNA